MSKEEEYVHITIIILKVVHFQFSLELVSTNVSNNCALLFWTTPYTMDIVEAMIQYYSIFHLHGATTKSIFVPRSFQLVIFGTDQEELKRKLN
jgi:hypothetical protein